MIRAIDLFCGAGGSSWGAWAAGVKLLAGFDCWDLAIKTYEDNFSEARTYRRKLEYVSAREVAREVGKVDLILASPECNNHTHARGRRRPSEDSRNTAFQVLRFTRVLKPRWIAIENVINMKSWKRYPEFIERIEELGYKVREQTLDSAQFGVPQSRKRLFIMCDNEANPPEVKSRRLTPLVPAKSFINLDGEYPFSALFSPSRATATLQRARRAMRKMGAKRPFLLVYYSTDAAGGWQKLNVPLRTVTTIDRFALVRWTRKKPVMRMLQPDELREAMGFPSSFKLEHGTRRDRIHLLGNAVCPPVMKAVVQTLVGR